MVKKNWRIIVVFFISVFGINVFAGDIKGSFIQLNRESANKSTDYWDGIMLKMHKAGLSLIIVQWSSEDNISYFRDSSLEQTEQYDALDVIFTSARKLGMEIWLGLHNDRYFWTQIGARDKALYEYFLVRVAQNEKIQKALLHKYGNDKMWTGYYVPDEIDDFNWREKNKRMVIKKYFSLMTERIRVNDASNRLVAVSTFFRPRTAPSVFAVNVADIVIGSGLDAILVQDGRGTIYDSREYVDYYFSAIKEFIGKHSKPVIWSVVEIFQQIPGKDDSFSARPAPPEKVEAQISLANKHFGPRIIVFSFEEYADPSKGDDHRKIFDVLVGHKQ